MVLGAGQGVNAENLLDMRGFERDTSSTMHVNLKSLANLFSNPIFMSAACSLIIVQFLKTLLNLFKVTKTDFKEALLVFLWRTGGMPSSHSAIAVSISSSIALTEGFSDLFILSLFLSLIVIRDALGVRRSSGLQAKALNRLGSEVGSRLGLEYEPVREVHGHTWPEVLVGALLGFAIALFFSWGSMKNAA
jgi:acid phosphatase family membrane protein YuiD